MFSVRVSVRGQKIEDVHIRIVGQKTGNKDNDQVILEGKDEEPLNNL